MVFVNGRWGGGPVVGREGPSGNRPYAGARPPLDVAEYIHNLGEAGSHLGTGRLRPKAAPALDRSSLNSHTGVQEDPSRPVLHGQGPVEASTCTGLQVTPTAIWDVNGYYRRLGFGWPFTPTRVELRTAYGSMGASPSPEVAYSFKQLWNRWIRADYDRAPLGEPYFDDLVSESLKREARVEAGRRWARDGVEVDPRKVLEDWGLTLPEESGDQSSPAEPRDKPDRPSVTPEAEEFWPWAFYLWRSTKTSTGHLARWQEMLISRFAFMGMQEKFSVGYFGKQPHSWVSVKVGRRRVILLNEHAEPTIEMARQAVEFVRQGQLD